MRMVAIFCDRLSGFGETGRRFWTREFGESVSITGEKDLPLWKDHLMKICLRKISVFVNGRTVLQAIKNFVSLLVKS